MLTPHPPDNEADLLEWHRQQSERLAQLAEHHAKQWEYFNTQEYKDKVLERILDATHSDSPKPWEDEDL
jgi:hypothetical protein